MTGMQNAVKMLRDRIAVILETVKHEGGKSQRTTACSGRFFPPRGLPWGTLVDHELGPTMTHLMMAYLCHDQRKREDARSDQQDERYV